jgi:hypothetical protein
MMGVPWTLMVWPADTVCVPIRKPELSWLIWIADEPAVIVAGGDGGWVSGVPLPLPDISAAGVVGKSRLVTVTLISQLRQVSVAVISGSVRSGFLVAPTAAVDGSSPSAVDSMCGIFGVTIGPSGTGAVSSGVVVVSAGGAPPTLGNIGTAVVAPPSAVADCSTCAVLGCAEKPPEPPAEVVGLSGILVSVVSLGSSETCEVNICY